MIKAKRLSNQECKYLLLPEAYDVFILSDWAIWEMRDGITIDYVLMMRTGPKTRELHSVRVTRDELSQTILNLAQGVDE